MAEFIEVETISGKVLINLNNISNIRPSSEDACLIYLKEEKEKPFRAFVSYEDLKGILQKVGELK